MHKNSSDTMVDAFSPRRKEPKSQLHCSPSLTFETETKQQQQTKKINKAKTKESVIIVCTMLSKTTMHFARRNGNWLDIIYQFPLHTLCGTSAPFNDPLITVAHVQNVCVNREPLNGLPTNQQKMT